MWLTKVHTSQEAPTFISGSSSLEIAHPKFREELRGLTNESFLTKIFKSDGRY